jgi:uncharacterized protein (DUF488 family)
MKRIFTIGHGNKKLEGLIYILGTHEIEILVDIRAYPRSQRNPQFNREELEIQLPQSGMAYSWFKRLGGHKRTGLGEDSPNMALKSRGLRNYADFMLSKSFKETMGILWPLLRAGKACLLCAETLPFKCHRWILSDYLTACGVEVIHLLDAQRASFHKLSKYARAEEGNIFYDRLSPMQQPLDFGDLGRR